MTRFARMPKKKYLEATSWEELSQKQQGEQNETQVSEQPKQNQIPELLSKNKKKMRSRKRKTENKDILDESVLNAKKKMINDLQISESKIDKKKSKKKEMSHSNDTDKKKTKENTSNDDSKLSNSEEMKKKCFRSRKEEKLERQREARRRRRAKSKGLACFHCRQLGHLAAGCPQINQGGVGIGVCYKCGSTDHTTKNCKEDNAGKTNNPFPFAKCFICGETGHLARGCPDNPKGLYPKGGGCNICGSVEHLKRDCPDAIKFKQKDKNFKVKGVVSNQSSIKHASADAEVHSDEEKPHIHKPHYKKEKIVKF